MAWFHLLSRSRTFNFSARANDGSTHDIEIQSSSAHSALDLARRLCAWHNLAKDATERRSHEGGAVISKPRDEALETIEQFQAAGFSRWTASMRAHHMGYGERGSRIWKASVSPGWLGWFVHRETTIARPTDAPAKQ